MAEKLFFSLKVFTLGFSVVMIVLFALYGLTAFFNRLTLPVSKKKEGPSRQGADGVPSQQMAAAIAAVLNYHQAALLDSTPHSAQEIQPPPVRGTRWQAAGREELTRKSTRVDLLRRKHI